MPTSSSLLTWVVAAATVAAAAAGAGAGGGAGGSFEEFEVVWGGDHVGVADGGRLVTLTLDNSSGAGFQSKDQFLFGEFTMQMKLVPNDSAGTVATFYLTSQGDAHDEVDFEFLGNLSGEPYVMHTNVFAQGRGGREQQFYLWFDPTADFHNYTILWNPLNVIFSVDGKPVRVFKNHERSGVPYLDGQAMRVHASLWDGESWATRGGQVKTNWAHAPFVASYRGYAASACVVSGDGNRNSSTCPPPGEDASPWVTRQLDAAGRRAVAWARENYMIYDYCGDHAWPSPQGRPPECGLDRPPAMPPQVAG